MADELADRIRAEIGGLPGLGEIRMMGGLCFTLHGNMLVGIMKGGDLLARVGADGYDAALERPGAGPMEFTGRPMKGFVNVDAAVLDDATLKEWLSTCLAFVGPMPPKEKKAKKT
ncbi:MAG: TfoX/Sxy family protein [Brucellaceae bacterium]|nr:TfoX/Sxy family protein [Brucellaceae bacterium]